MARVNIGTNKGNIVNHDMKKPYNQITFADIVLVAKSKFGDGNIHIHGWAQNFNRINGMMAK